MELPPAMTVLVTIMAAETMILVEMIKITVTVTTQID